MYLMDGWYKISAV